MWSDFYLAHRVVSKNQRECLLDHDKKNKETMISSPNSRHAKQLNLEVLLGGFLYGKKIKIHYRF